MSSLLIKNVRAVDIGLDRSCDIFIEDGVISEISDKIDKPAEKTINADGLTAIPSLFDMHVHLRDPGLTHKEDILTGAKAALAGGITGVACMPNTIPAIDNEETIKYIYEKSKDTGVKVYPVGCITKGMAGDELCDYEMLKDAGAVAVSDDGKPVKNAAVMLKALQKSILPVISHCEDMDIIGKGTMHKGAVSARLGVAGMDRASEDSITARELALAHTVDAKIHIAHVSTEGSIALVRDAKARGIKATCETCPHYFMLTHDELMRQDANYRMNPPLREESDVQAIINGITDGTVDCIVTDHAPHTSDEKSDFLTAPNGVVGMETSLAATLTALYHKGKITLEDVVRLMSVNPRKILGIAPEQIKVGAAANIAIVNLNKKWIVVPEKLHSKSHNTVFGGMELTGKVVFTISDGKVLYME